MGVLKARVSGAWVPVSQGFSSAIVGFVGIGVPPGTQSAIAATTVDLTGQSVTFTADPTHRYKTTAYVVGRQGATGSEQYVYIADSSNNHLKASAYDVPANGIATHVVEIIETGLSGSTVRKARAQSSSASTWGTAGAPWFAYIIVEDITSMTPAGPDTGPWTAFVPTLTQGVVVTKTVNSATYMQIGRTVHAQVNLTVTGAGSSPSGVRIGLPVPARAINAVVGGGAIFDASAGVRYICGLTGGGNTSEAFFVVNGTSSDVFGASPILALASPDTLTYSVTYEAA